MAQAPMEGKKIDHLEVCSLNLLYILLSVKICPFIYLTLQSNKKNDDSLLLFLPMNT